MHWKTKAAIFRVLVAMPFADQLLYGLQRYVTREWPRPTVPLDNLLKAARRLEQAASGRNGRFVEIGAGGDLAIAIAIRMLGVEHVTCVDITRLARLPLIQHAANHMAQRLGMKAPSLRSWDDLEAFGISYLAPGELGQLADQRGTFDCFFTADTLEHIPGPALRAVLGSARELLKPDGISVHFIDYSDHYARRSDSSRFNFLTFDHAAWRPYNTRLHYVNRLRHSQYLTMFAETGYSIVAVEADVAPAQPEIVAKLAEPFRSMPLDDLFTLRAMIVARS
jgi:hypothetical protein